MKRILLKLSGEALAGEKEMGFDEPTITAVANQVKEIVDSGVQAGIVIGGGNFWRGRTSKTIDRTKADQIGMLATAMNCNTNIFLFPMVLDDPCERVIPAIKELGHRLRTVVLDQATENI